MDNIYGLKGPFCVQCQFCIKKRGSSYRFAKCRAPQVADVDSIKALILAQGGISSEEVLDTLSYCTHQRRGFENNGCGPEGRFYSLGAPTNLLPNGIAEKVKPPFWSNWFTGIFKKKRAGVGIAVASKQT